MAQTPRRITLLDPDQQVALAADQNTMAGEVDVAIGEAVAPLQPSGTSLTSGNADTVAAGVWVVPFMSAAQNISNLPVTWPGVLVTSGTGAAKYQTYAPTFIGANSGTGANLPQLYQRRVNQSGGWRPWVALGGSTAGTREGALRLEDMRLRLGPVKVTTPAAVTIVMDHGLTNVETKVLPLMRARGLTATLAINSNKWADAQNSGATQAEVQGWVDVFEIANHGRDHLLTGGLGDRDEIVLGRTELETQLGIKVDTYVQTGNGAAGSYAFDDGRTAKAYWETDTGRAITESHAVWTGLVPNPTHPAYPMDGEPRPGATGLWIDTGTSTAQTAVASAISAGGQRVMLRLHPQFLDTSGYLTTAQLTSFLDWLVARRNAGELTVLTYRKWSLAESVRVGTGWVNVNITNAAGSVRDPANPGMLQLWRDGNRVTARLSGIKLVSGSGSGFLLPNALPVGYQARDVQGPAVCAELGDAASATYRHSVHVSSNDIYWRGWVNSSNTYSTTRLDILTLQGEITWVTDDPFPA